MELRTTLTTVLAAVSLTGLVACGGTGSTEPAADALATSTATQQAAQQGAVQSAELSISDAWVKSADEGMSAAFGVLTTNGEDVVITSATTAASSMMELHETVAGDDGQMAMREKDGGFTVTNGSDMVLEPGGNHLMLMDLTAPLQAGDTVEVELVLEDGSSFMFEAPVKDFSGANESYEGDGMDMEMDMGEEMDMGMTDAPTDDTTDR